MEICMQDYYDREREICSVVSDSVVHGILQARMLEPGSHSLLQGKFPTQELNPGLPHCRWILYQLSHQGSSQDYYKEK